MMNTGDKHILDIHDEHRRQQTKQHNTTQHKNTRDNSFFQIKMSCLRWDLNPRHSILYMSALPTANSATKLAQMARAQITNTTQYNPRQGVSITRNLVLCMKVQAGVIKPPMTPNTILSYYMTTAILSTTTCIAYKPSNIEEVGRVLFLKSQEIEVAMVLLPL